MACKKLLEGCLIKMTEIFDVLAAMKYSGRGITVGMTKDRNPFVGYTLTGRSPSSQARKLAYDLDSLCVRTQVTDEEQLKKGNPALLIYPAISHVGERIVASNGAQTSLLIGCAQGCPEDIFPKRLLLQALDKSVVQKDKDGQEIDITSYEPDSPNFTPRINACLDSSFGAFYIMKKGTDSSRYTNLFPFSLTPGKAKLITTYKGGNENPLLPFEGMPLEFNVSSTRAEDICEALYESIGPKEENNYRVASAVMLKNRGTLEVFTINRSEIGN